MSLSAVTTRSRPASGLGGAGVAGDPPPHAVSATAHARTAPRRALRLRSIRFLLVRDRHCGDHRVRVGRFIVGVLMLDAHEQGTAESCEQGSDELKGLAV